jgi:hypothetical protein
MIGEEKRVRLHATERENRGLQKGMPMSRVQELIDERMADLPVGLAKDLLEACKEEAEARPQLYQLTWTTVSSDVVLDASVEHVDDEDFARVKLSHQTQTLIVEAVDELADHPEPFSHRHPRGNPRKMCAGDMPHHGMVLKSWLKRAMPRVHAEYAVSDSMIAIHSIVPYEPHKRSREA